MGAMKYDILAKNYSHFCRMGFLELEAIFLEPPTIKNIQKGINKFFALKDALAFLSKKKYLKLLTSRIIDEKTVSAKEDSLNNLFHFSSIEIGVILRLQDGETTPSPLCPSSIHSAIFIAKNSTCDFKSLWGKNCAILLFGNINTCFQTNDYDPLEITKFDHLRNPLVEM